MKEGILDNLLKGVNLYLVGMMGCGKSTIGKILAKQLGYQFFDTDSVIEQVTGRSITEIFTTEGEAAFRELESQVLAELSARTRLAIATGGGIVLRQMNWSYLRHGLVVWIDVPVMLLYDRLRGDDTRPLLQAENPLQKLEQLMAERRSLYAQADVRVPVDGHYPPDKVARLAMEGMRQVIREPVRPPESGMYD